MFKIYLAGEKIHYLKTCVTLQEVFKWYVENHDDNYIVADGFANVKKIEDITYGEKKANKLMSC